MNKAFIDFDWENFPSLNTPINATNLNKLNDALDTIDDRVIDLNSNKVGNDAVSDEIETLNSEALYAHDAGSFFLASNGKVYKVTVSISIGDTIEVGTNCTLDNIIDNLGGSSPAPVSGGHIICDGQGTQFTQRPKLVFENATITDDSTNDATVVTPTGGGSSATVLTQTLAAGSTSVTFTNIPTTGNYLIDFYNSIGIPLISMDTSVSGQVTLTFDEQSSNVTVFCKIEEVSLA